MTPASGNNILHDRDTQFQLHAQTNPHSHEANGPFIISRGDGPFVFDNEGRRYLEAMSGLWCASLGFSNKRLAEAAGRAYDMLGYYHSFGGRSTPSAIDAAHAIAELVPIQNAHVFFATSGSEAIETMVKLAWLHFKAHGQGSRRKIIARDRAFHGSTIFAAALTGLPHMHREFGISQSEIVRVACPDPYRGKEDDESNEMFASRLARDLEAAILAEGPETIAAFVVEPINAGAGVIIPPDTYFAEIQPVLKKYGILLLADEIVCGFGRTGHWFGSNAFGIQPDMVAMAKGLSSSYFPISAVAVSSDIYNSVKLINAGGTNFGHGFTNSAHPVGTAIVNEVLAIYSEMQVLQRVNQLGNRMLSLLNERLSGCDVAGDIRGKGLLAAVELVDDKKSKTSFSQETGVLAAIERRARDKGLILRPQGQAIVFCPPFVVTEAQVDEMVDTVCDIVLDLRQIVASQ
ncbi:aminotransferase [Agrobacterium rosae]|uniref:aminotransferase n=1 Tax=Agrobacterium rosae TaxID=1972867 RepID=UPI00203371CF|nr:aminotransferase [Agrobacterium rosae]MCM2435768.1 aminotransferase class III-fold pyridoxal phosphate-dependent enzyme [Agrobacterium rosae]